MGSSVSAETWRGHISSGSTPAIHAYCCASLLHCKLFEKEVEAFYFPPAQLSTLGTMLSILWAPSELLLAPFISSPAIRSPWTHMEM